MIKRFKIYKFALALAACIMLAAAEFTVCAAPSAAGGKYLWLASYNEADSINSRIAPPAGYKRTAEEPGGFAEWLRSLPLKPGKPPVYLYNKKLKANQGAHYAVVDIGCGARDLQQCADAVMRLRAEYLFARGDIKSISFMLSDKKMASFTGWLAERLVKSGRPAGETEILKAAGYENFQKYMVYIFSYAGTYSLSKSLKKVKSVKDIRAGDVFVKGGFPGHAVIVADTAENEKGEKVFLLLQSYMPAQDVHVLNNPAGGTLHPWYGADFGETLNTPEWDFTRDELMRF
ncbi:MAG TPA: DUF4846 domain-containing protein [Candidatus Wallbacteria bacterium]|nr:DUF4846 domain-containing protein [Candidatus Wallbacteria bacterium]